MLNAQSITLLHRVFTCDTYTSRTALCMRTLCDMPHWRVKGLGLISNLKTLYDSPCWRVILCSYVHHASPFAAVHLVRMIIPACAPLDISRCLHLQLAAPFASRSSLQHFMLSFSYALGCASVGACRRTKNVHGFASSFTAYQYLLD